MLVLYSTVSPRSSDALSQNGFYTEQKISWVLPEFPALVVRNSFRGIRISTSLACEKHSANSYGVAVLQRPPNRCDCGSLRLVAQYVLLFVTTYVSVFSVYDIYDDCVRRYVNDAQTKSDAVVCAQLCTICPARGWGVVWLVVSMGFWAGGVCYLVLHVGGHLDL